MRHLSEAAHLQGRTMSCLLSEARRHNLSEVTSVRRNSPFSKVQKTRRRLKAAQRCSEEFKSSFPLSAELQVHKNQQNKVSVRSWILPDACHRAGWLYFILFHLHELVFFLSISCFYCCKYGLCLHPVTAPCLHLHSSDPLNREISRTCIRHC